MNYEILPATETDRAELLSLYRAQLGREYCPWNEEYPSDETIDFDLGRDALFVLKTEGIIAAAVSLDEDEAVADLPCWNKDFQPEGELARIAVLPGMQGRGLGRIILQYGMDEWQRRGCRGIRMLVNRHNVKAIRMYAPFAFDVVGECHMYEQDFLCYEKAL